MNTAQKIISGEPLSKYSYTRKMAWNGQGTIYLFPDGSRLFHKTNNCFFNVSTLAQEQEHLHGSI